MSDSPPIAAAGDGVPLEQLAATAQMLADGLAAAALHCEAELRRPRLQLVSVTDRPKAGETGLSIRARAYLRARRLREGLFPDRIFADPAWDMLLDLFACKLEGRKVSVSNACIAANVPSTTALRSIDRLEECGLVTRRRDPADSRRIYVEIAQIAAWRIELWLNATFHTDPPAQV